MLLQDDVSGCEMSDKTPGQVALGTLLFLNFKDATLDEGNAIASAVIAHVRPQIEAEARAAVVEECARAATNSDSVNWAWRDAEALAADRIRAITSAPPGYVCVPVEPTEEMIAAADKHSKEWSKTLRPLQPLNKETWRDACIGRYKAMLAAARQK